MSGSEFFGFDHIDCRVRSLAAVESFYDELLPRLGLTEKRYAYIDSNGGWHREFDTYNVIEYYEPEHPTKPRRFIGFIEDPLHRKNDTRIAFRVPLASLSALAEVAMQLGAEQLAWSDAMESHPAFFFEDPAGTRLEIIGRA